MTTTQFMRLGLILLILAWAGSAAISYGVVEVTGGGPQGDQGPPGPKGDQGARGLQGPSGTSADIDFGSDLAIGRLAQMFAVNTLLQEGLVQPGERLSSTHPQVKACVDYIVDGTGSFVECGFQRIDE